MVGNEDQAVDWRDGTAYAPLLVADRSIIAWEWLRRDPGYRKAALAALGAEASVNAARPDEWGLCAFERPDLAAPRARPVWSCDVYPAVLASVADGKGTESDRIDLDRLAGLATLVRVGCGTEHVLLSDGLNAIRVDVLAGSVGERPVRLRYILGGLASAERPLLTLQRLLALCRAGRFGRSLHRPEARARRWLLMLRVHDALAAGARQREIAAALLSRSASEPRWRSEAPSVRLQVQRLVRGARLMAEGGYLELLR